MERLFTNRILMFLSIFILSVFSITTTAYGLSMYLGNATVLGYAVSFGIQVALLVAVFVMVSTAKKGISKIRITALVLYLAALTFSVSGSYIQFENWLQLDDREREITDVYCEPHQQYQNDIRQFINERKAVVANSIAKMEKLLIEEDNDGFFSKKGAGKGPMYRMLNSSIEPLRQSEKRLGDALVKLDGCSAGTSGDEASSGEPDKNLRENCKDTSECARGILGLVDSDESINYTINQAYSIARKAKYGKFITAIPPLGRTIPAFPSVNAEAEGSNRIKVSGAWYSLFKGDGNSILAFIFSIALDILIFMFALLNSLVERIHNSSSDVASKDLEYIRRQYLENKHAT